jgi:hypothetical protein
VERGGAWKGCGLEGGREGIQKEKEETQRRKTNDFNNKKTDRMKCNK